VKKEDRIKIIVDKRFEMEWAVTLINGKFFVPSVEVMKTIHNDEIIKAQKWIENIPAYLELCKVWKLRKPETWKNYDLYGDGDKMPEVRLLKTAKNGFRMAIVSRSRPDLFKKTKVKEWTKDETK
jgi:hypothetical protein